jgi:hypothetical protein
MSVMLRSTNPAAVNEIDPDRDRRVPYQGQRVLFHSRPGEGRSGKMTAIADVMAVEDDDHCELLIHYAADDAIVRWKIPRRTEQNPFNSWSFTEYDQYWYQRSAGHPGEPPPPSPESHLTWDDVKAMHAEIGVLRNKVVALEAKPKRGRPPGSSKHEAEGGEEASADIEARFLGPDADLGHDHHE